MLLDLQCIQGYLSGCPTRGKDLVIELLLRRVPLTDEDALRLGQALQQVLVSGCSAPGDMYACGTPAAVVMLARGDSWYQRGNRSGLVRAMFFFQLAGNGDRSKACLERTLWALCATVRACNTLFQGLSFYPDQPCKPTVGYRLQWNGLLDETHERVRQRFALDDLSTYLSPRHWPVSYVNSPAWREKMGDPEEGADPDIIPIGPVEPAACTIDEFREALRFAQDMLGAVRDPLFLTTDPAAVSLSTYTRALSTLFSAIEISFKLHDLSLSIALTAQQRGISVAARREHVTEAVLEGCVRCLEGFQSAAIDFHDLLVSRALPRGYWLHLLDLCVWIDRQVREASDSVRVLSALATASPVNTPLQLRLNSLDPNIFGKSHAYALISALVQLESGPPDSESGRHLAYADPGDIAQLRLSLAGVLTTAQTAGRQGADVAKERALLAVQAQREFLPHLRSC